MINQIERIKDKKWDNLIILDACRFDYFKEVLKENYLDINMRGKLIKANSHSKHTGEWYKNNWSKKNKDVILISQHPRAWKEKLDKNFFKTYPLWKRDDWIILDIYLEKMKKVMNQYNNKKILVHLTPPHLPYRDNEGKEFLNKIYKVGGGPKVYQKVREYGNKNGWNKLIYYYKKNILKCIKLIDKYINDLTGKIVITADHGELIGEDRFYGHNRSHPKIFRVPWFEIRKEI